MEDGSFGKHKSHKLPLANWKCRDRGQSRRRDFATEKQGVASVQRSDEAILQSLFGKPFQSRTMLCGRASENFARCETIGDG